MKRILAPLSLVALFAWLAVSCEPKQSPASLSGFSTSIGALSADGVKLSWLAVPHADRSVVTWKSLDGKSLGSLTVKGNEAYIRPNAQGQTLQFSVEAFEGEKSLGISTFALSMRDPYSASYENDTIVSGDVIIQLVTPFRPNNAEPYQPWCKLTYDSCTVTQYCDGSAWFRIRRSTAEELYRVTVTGYRADRTLKDVRFLVRVDTSGAVSFVGQDVLACMSLDPRRSCSVGRTTTYDDGDLAFSMCATSTSRERGITIKPIDNVAYVRVGKSGGCE
ncbi:MAG TPA: hypothetical protein PK971_09885 [Saprospiraceae bacterium]|nr:hypothetical protein [Saprospiraceae bacterium]